MAGVLESDRGGSQELFLKYGCMAKVTFPQYGMSCRGIGVTEEPLDGDERKCLGTWASGPGTPLNDGLASNNLEIDHGYWWLVDR